MGLAAVYASIRAHTRVKLCLYVLHDDSVDGLSKSMLEQSLVPGDRLLFRHASSVPEAYELSKKLDNRYSPAIIWRAWIGEYFYDLKRCLLLDCDLLFLCDVERLWKTRLGSSVLSAPIGGGWRLNDDYFQWLNSSRESYFRMCVVLINLKKLRKSDRYCQGRVKFLNDAFSRMGSGPGSYLLEQSLFNKFFSQLCKPLLFEVFAANRISENSERHAYLSAKIAQKKPLIVDVKGWENDSEFSLLYWSFLLRTAWFSFAQKAWAGFMKQEPPRSPS